MHGYSDHLVAPLLVVLLQAKRAVKEQAVQFLAHGALPDTELSAQALLDGQKCRTLDPNQDIQGHRRGRHSDNIICQIMSYACMLLCIGRDSSISASASRMHQLLSALAGYRSQPGNDLLDIGAARGILTHAVVHQLHHCCWTLLRNSESNSHKCGVYT